MLTAPRGIWTNQPTSCSRKVRRGLVICDDCEALTGGFRPFCSTYRSDSRLADLDDHPFVAASLGESPFMFDEAQAHKIHSKRWSE
jgi:hypothetical protein